MAMPPVQYVRTSDGYDIAYCTSGSGKAFLTVPWPRSHLQLNWVQPGEQLQLTKGLAERFRLIQYDARGQGLSTRNLPEDVTCDDFLRDIEAVVDRLALDRIILYGWGNAMGHIALLFAARYPERVDGLVLHCSAVHASDWPSSLFIDLPSQNWDYYLRQVVRARTEANLRLMDAGTPAVDPDTLYNYLRESVHQRDWQVTLRAFLQSDVSGLLGALKVPTLILHQRDFRPLPAEEAAKLAARIPGAHLVLLEGSSQHGEPDHVLSAIDDFVAGLPDRNVSIITSGLSSRESEVLRLVAAGQSNQQIADELVISLNTARKHVANILDKTGTANRTEAAGYARDHGLA